MAYTSRVLVMARQTAASDDLRDALLQRAKQGDVAFTLLMPADDLGLTGREASRPKLDAAVARLREAGLEVTGICGDHDPFEAVAEVCPPGSFDEIYVATLPDESSAWYRGGLLSRIRTLTNMPVHRITARPPRELHVEHLEPPEKQPLGPLSVLGWGHNGAG